MKQAHVRCLCQSLRLPDLQLNLVRGQEVVLGEDAARGSKDLARALRYQGVQLWYVTVCETQRDKLDITLSVPPVRPRVRSAPQAVIPVAPPTPVVAPPTPVVVQPPLLSASGIDLIAREILSRLQSLLPSLVGSFVSPVGGTVKKEPESVRFIPEGLVGRASGSIDVKVTETESDQVAVASAVLRNSKRKKND